MKCTWCGCKTKNLTPVGDHHEICDECATDLGHLIDHQPHPLEQLAKSQLKRDGQN